MFEIDVNFELTQVKDGQKADAHQSRETRLLPSENPRWAHKIQSKKENTEDHRE